MKGRPRVTRRRFCRTAGGALTSVMLTGACRGNEPPLTRETRITARPRAARTTFPAGMRPLGLGNVRDAIVQLPATAASGPLPLMVLLHGAGGSAAGILGRVGSAADSAGVAVLAPDSRDSTWDVILDDFGPDVVFLNRALDRVFETVAVDPAHVSIGGFSDGATYALSLGLINGDLFRRIVAFSPGYFIEGTPHGQPDLFISHGSADTILPIDSCSRAIVPRLQKRGYAVTFREFAGGHEVPARIALEGMRWAAAP